MYHRLHLNVASHASEPTCIGCGDVVPELGDNSVCEICRIDPLPTVALFSCWYLSPQVRTLVSALKYRGRFALASLFAKELEVCLENSSARALRESTVIVPLPSGDQTFRRRGYSHTALIAKALSKRLELPVSFVALYAKGNRARQTGLVLRARRENIAGAFGVTATEIVDKRVLLIDDVVTSGSSISEATYALRAAGAASIFALTVARSRHFRRYRLVLAHQKNKLRLDRMRKRS